MSKIPYENLKSHFGRIAALNEAAAMLHWDASAMMPSGGGAARGDQLATLAGLAHELLTAPVVAAELALAEAEGEKIKKGTKTKEVCKGGKKREKKDN